MESMGHEVRTSITHPLRIDWLPSEGAGRVGMTFAPGRKAWARAGYRWERDLDADLGVIVAEGGATLVSLLTDGELAPSGIPDLYERARAHGLEVLRLPIPDVDVPRELAAVHRLVEQIHERVARGQGVVIHCAGGLGRTGTIAGCYLVRCGMSPDDALRMLVRVRQSDECPQTAAQRAFIRDFVPRTARAPASAPGAASYADVLTGLGADGPIELATTAGGIDRADVTRRIAAAEHEVRAAAGRSFQFDASGNATLTIGGRAYAAGRFATPSIDTLRARISRRPRTATGRVRLSVIHGADALTDIGTLQATAGPGSLFQAASQFNCLEAPGARIVPVSDYTSDNTQGPRASVSAFPATLLRQYQAPPLDGNGPRFEQTDHHQLNLLADAFAPEIAEVKAGYLQSQHVHQPEAFVRELDARFGSIRVGVHDDVEVVFGRDWGGPVPAGPAHRIAQVFTSTIALGGYSRGGDAEVERVACRQLLRAAYLGTLLAAVDLAKQRVVLTMIGGGVFGNPIAEIWQAIFWAIGEVEPLLAGDLEVVVNARSGVAAEAREEVRRRGGAVVGFEANRIVIER